MLKPLRHQNNAQQGLRRKSKTCPYETGTSPLFQETIQDRVSIHRHEIQRRCICQAGAEMGGTGKLKRWSQTDENEITDRIYSLSFR